MTQAKTLARSTIYLFSTEILDKLLSFFLVVVITRYLGELGFGKYSFAFAYFKLATVIAGFGLITYMFREISKDRRKTEKIVSNVVTIELVSNLIIMGVMILIASFVPKTQEIIGIILIVSVIELLNVFCSIFRTVFAAYEKNEFRMITVMIERVIALAFGYLVLVNGTGIYGLLLAIFTARLIGTVSNYILLFRKVTKIYLKFEFKFWKRIIRDSLPFWFSLFATIVYYQVDKVMLSAIKNYTVTGIYSAASTLLNALVFIPLVIIIATFPSMSRFYHKNWSTELKTLYQKSFYYLLAIAVPITIGTFLLAERLILLIYGEVFLNSALVLQVLISSLVFIFLNHIMGYLLNSSNKQHLFLIANLSVLVVNIIANFILIPIFSHIGAAIATVIAQSGNFLLLLYFTIKNGYKIPYFNIFWRPIIAGIVMGIFIFLSSDHHIAFIISIASLIYLSVLYLIKGINKEEIALFRSFFPK